MIPKIFNFSSKKQHSKKLFADLRLNNILSENALLFMLNPCDKYEILRRQELFRELIETGETEALSKCLTELKSLKHVTELYKTVNNEIEKIYYKLEFMSAYINVVNSFLQVTYAGELINDVVTYFTNQKQLIFEMCETVKFCKECMSHFSPGLMSISETIWVTPDKSVNDDYGCVCDLASKLGLKTSRKKRFDLLVDESLSNALCLMYANELRDITFELEKFSDINFGDVLSYIPEIEFIFEIISLVNKASDMGLKFTFPSVSNEPIYVAEGLADISMIAKETKTIICNDLDFSDYSFSFLIGANSGGKTTFLRAVGINLILFLIGCPVFSERAEIFPFDYVDAHFTTDERYKNQGRLDDEITRIEDILKNASDKQSFLMFNETFSGTDEKRGYDLLKTTVDRLVKNKHFGIWVTHFNDVLRLNMPILTAEVSEDNERTYRISRSKNWSSSYANDILKKYKIDKKSLELRRKMSVN